MKYPRITIVTPSFNQAQYIEQTIDSVLSQNYSNLEYIIIDGNSADNSAALISKYEKHLSYWISEPDRGQSHAINKGIQRATGEIFNWLNSDDYLEADSLKTIAENFQDPSTNVVCGRSNIVQNKKIIRASKGTDIYNGNLAKTLGWSRIDQPETYFRKRIYDKLGLLNESLHYVMDKEFWMRYLINFGLNGIVQIPDLLANFRLHDDSKTQNQQQAFAKETNTLFLQLALQNGQTVEGSFVEKIFDTQPTDLKGLSSDNFKIVRAALHYFLLYKADELYYNNQSAKAHKIINFIDQTSIEENDITLIKKLHFRTRLPQFIINVLRKWKSV